MFVTNLDALVLGRPAVAGHDPAEKILERHILHVERLSAAFESRQVQQIADDVLDALRLVANDGQIAFAGFRIERLRMKRERFEVAPHAGERRHQLVRYVREQQPSSAVGGLQLLGALMEIVRHLVERARQRRNLVAAVFARASRQIARTDFARGLFEASQPGTDRAENQQRSDCGANDDKHRADHRQRRAELTQRRTRHRNHNTDRNVVDDDGACRARCAAEPAVRASAAGSAFGSRLTNTASAASPAAAARERLGIHIQRRARISCTMNPRRASCRRSKRHVRPS